MLSHPPVHLRSAGSYGVLNCTEKSGGIPEYRLRELRDELGVRGLPFRMTDNCEDPASILITNDGEWRRQLLDLERTVLSKLWDKAKIDTILQTERFQNRQYLEYGELEEGLVNSTRGAAPFHSLPAKLLVSRHAAREMILSIASQEHAVLDPQVPKQHADVARKIAEFRARKIATEGSVTRQ